MLLLVPTSSYTTSTLSAASDASPELRRDFFGWASGSGTWPPPVGDETRFLLPEGIGTRWL